MSEYEEIARIRVREAIQEGLASQKNSQDNLKQPPRALYILVTLFLLGVWILFSL